MYDALAPHYREHSNKKAAYLEAVERIVIQRIPPGARSLLDVGAGDGVRAVRIAQARQISTLVLAEPCEAMIALCRQQPATEVWPVAAEALPETSQRFDVITCLWNVLGHVSDHAARVTALQNMRRLLAENGVIFFDVNNRYNARSYGWLEIVRRIFQDLLNPSEAHGDASFDWHIDGKTIRAMGHVFKPGEVANLVCEAELKVNRRYVVDYQTGQQLRFVFGGQLLCEVGKDMYP